MLGAITDLSSLRYLVVMPIQPSLRYNTAKSIRRAMGGGRPRFDTTIALRLAQLSVLLSSHARRFAAQEVLIPPSSGIRPIQSTHDSQYNQSSMCSRASTFKHRQTSLPRKDNCGARSILPIHTSRPRRDSLF